MYLKNFSNRPPDLRRYLSHSIRWINRAATAFFSANDGFENSIRSERIGLLSSRKMRSTNSDSSFTVKVGTLFLTDQRLVPWRAPSEPVRHTINAAENNLSAAFFRAVGGYPPLLPRSAFPPPVLSRCRRAYKSAQQKGNQAR